MYYIVERRRCLRVYFLCVSLNRSNLELLFFFRLTCDWSILSISDHSSCHVCSDNN